MGYVTIKTFHDFQTHILETITKRENRTVVSLERYLCSVYVLIAKHEAGPPPYPLIADILDEAFDTPPVPCDRAWLGSCPGGVSWWLRGRPHQDEQYLKSRTVAGHEPKCFERIII